jgi:methylase of polypeptide subunit release factors
MPNASVVGIDVLPRALDLAQETIAARGLQDRLQVRLLPVQDLADEAQFDMAWMPAPFLPRRSSDAGSAGCMWRFGRAAGSSSLQDVSMAMLLQWR